MADLWLPDAKVQVLSGVSGGAMQAGNIKVLLHTTEGNTISSAVNAYKSYPPHLIGDYKTDQVVQHIPLNKHSYALKSGDSDDDPVIQVEIVGFAGDSHNWPDAMYRWLAERIMAPIHRLCPYPLQGPPQGFKGAGEGIVLASPKSPLRFSRAGWQAFSGVVGHLHAPDPDHHWDPGRLDIARLLRYTQEELDVTDPAVIEAIETLQAQVRIMGEQMRILIDLMPYADSPYDFVTAMYRRVLNREPDDGGLLYWINKMDREKLPPSRVLDEFLRVAQGG